MMALKPSHVGSSRQPRPAGSGSGRRTQGGGRLARRRERERREWDRDVVAVVTMPDDRCAVADADEPGKSVSVHDGLVRLKDAGWAESQLQEF
jgi:hypothetical protein